MRINKRRQQRIRSPVTIRGRWGCNCWRIMSIGRVLEKLHSAADYFKRNVTIAAPHMRMIRLLGIRKYSQPARLCAFGALLNSYRSGKLELVCPYLNSYKEIMVGDDLA